MTAGKAEQHGLAEPKMLEKIDRLFACGVGEQISLPQIVVVGDQSSGKSSVLEGLINKPLPRDSGLCTRFATQIVFRRATHEKILVSIIPDQDAGSEHVSRVRTWTKSVSSLEPEEFKKIMQLAHETMGLSGDNGDGSRRPTFSNDVLRLEISGPDQEHLSVIDVPGIFKSTTEGLTTKSDIQLVRNMVKGYMDNPRSVMLAVIPANVDVATQEILELAAEADEPGDRTLGILTKPDLVDKGAESNVIAMLEGTARPMKLGWHVIRNPGQKDLQAVTDRARLESEFFRSTEPWNSLEKSKVGVEALRLRLKEVLSSLVKREFPRVKAEIKSRLENRKQKLQGLGPERNSSAEQMAFLIDLATKFQRLASLASSATHGADDIFGTEAAMRITPAVMSRMKTFSDEMAKYGEAYSFTATNDKGSKTTPVQSSTATATQPPVTTFAARKKQDLEALSDILHPAESLPVPHPGEIKQWLHQMFKDNRGFELGTFNASILATAMNLQCRKWTDISLGFVSDVIVLIHRFIGSALQAICVDRAVRDALSSKLLDELVRRYQKAIDCTKFLLEVENSDTPMTLNHYFNENLQKSRQGKATADLKQKAFTHSSEGLVVRLADATQSTHSMSNEEYVVQDIHDILSSYYKVSRKTFVDNVCKMAVMHHLLKCNESPLALFSPSFVSHLPAEDLEEIAGEAPALQRTRQQLTKEIASLSAAVKILL